MDLLNETSLKVKDSDKVKNLRVVSAFTFLVYVELCISLFSATPTGKFTSTYNFELKIVFACCRYMYLQLLKLSFAESFCCYSNFSVFHIMSHDLGLSCLEVHALLIL